MSNCRRVELPAVSVELHQLREVLRAVLHTIVFNRALGQVTPHDVESEFFDLTHVQCGCPLVEQKIEKGITEFQQWIEKSNAVQGQLILSFYEKRQRQEGGASTWFPQRILSRVVESPQEQKLDWEQWVVNVTMLSSDMSVHNNRYPAARLERQKQLQADVERVLLAVIKEVNDKRDHIPPVRSSQDALPFQFDIATSKTGSMLGLLKSIIKTSPPQVLH